MILQIKSDRPDYKNVILNVGQRMGAYIEVYWRRADMNLPRLETNGFNISTVDVQDIPAYIETLTAAHNLLVEWRDNPPWGKKLCTECGEADCRLHT